LAQVRKKNPLTDDQVKYLKSQNLIEGRKPNFHISLQIANHSGERAQYIKNRALDDQHYKQLITKYLVGFGSAKRLDINGLLLDKLPDVLSLEQKNNKVKNLLQALKQEGVIKSQGKSWRMSKRY
jgi:ATP-dependent DNA helicase RecG